MGESVSLPVLRDKENGPLREIAKAHLEVLADVRGRAAFLYAERTAAAASALDVRIIELEARAFERLDVVDGNALEIHFAHLVDQDFETIELIDIVRGIFRILKSHVIAESGTPSPYNSHAERDGRGVLLAHNLFHFRGRHWSNCKHVSIFAPCRFRRDF